MGFGLRTCDYCKEPYQKYINNTNIRNIYSTVYNLTIEDEVFDENGAIQLEFCTSICLVNYINDPQNKHEMRANKL